MRASKNNIVRIKNFVTAKEISDYISFADSMYPEEESSRAIVQADYYDILEKDIKSCRARIQRVIEDHCGFSITDLSGTALRKWYAGESQDPHADCEAIFFRNSDGIQMEPINNFSSIFIEYAALVYLNDDYEGGEIYFPEYGIDIKPEPGELIFFPGSNFYEHGVREITSGTRYAIMTFFTTPKLQYLWRNFVIDPTPLEFEDRSEFETMRIPAVYSRSNIPLHLKRFGDGRKPEKEVPKVEEKEQATVSEVHPMPQQRPQQKTKQRSTPYLFGKDTSQIFVVDDFLDEEEVSTILDLAYSINEWNPAGEDVYDDNGILIIDASEWVDRVCGADRLEKLNEQKYDVLYKAARKVMAEAEKNFNCKLKFREPALVRHPAGQHTPEPHADKQNIDGSYKMGMEDWDVSAVMYFNDNFEGGEIVFPQHELAINPSAGRVVMYPGDDAFIHYVDHVTEGTRWSCPLFFTVVDEDE